MQPTETVPYPSTAMTHPGMTGKNNEDRFAITGFRLAANNKTPILLAVLSDGIGGHRAGEVAAEIAVETITRRVSEGPVDQPPLLLQDAVTEASIAIQEAAMEDPARQGMGATIAVALIIGQRLYAGTVGDSRIYLVREGGIRQLSIDHTWIQEAIDTGVLSPEEVKGHPNAHVIRRYLGSPRPPELDQRLRVSGRENDVQAEANQGFILRPGDRLLLCSDGLTDLVNDTEILETLLNTGQEAAVQNLIDLANQRGGHDNITIIAIELPEWLKALRPAAVPRRGAVAAAGGWRYVAAGCLATLALAAIVTAVVFGLNMGWFSSGGQAATITPTPLALDTATPEAPITLPTVATTPTLAPLASRTPTETMILPEVLENGATLTPWPTNTLPPTATPTRTFTSTPTP